MARKYALFVGNSQYDSQSLDDLESPIADVRDLAEVFRDTEIGGFDEVLELINSQEAEIRQSISSFFLHKKPDDLLLLYFSGHGILDDKGRLYLAVKDTQPDLLKATSISADFIADDMDSCRSKRQILILDCCHSGAFRQGIKGGNNLLNATTFEGNGSGRIILTASDRRGYAMEGNKVLEQAQSSLFTHYLLEGIVPGEADRDGDCYISLDEWYDYAYDKVVSKLPTQTPRRWVYNQEGKLIIARNPQPDKIKPPELSPALQASLEDSRATVRLRAASELAEILQGADQRLAMIARERLEKILEDESEKVRAAAQKILTDSKSQPSYALENKNISHESRSSVLIDHQIQEGTDAGSVPDGPSLLGKRWTNLFESFKDRPKMWGMAATLLLCAALIIMGIQLYPVFFTASLESSGADPASTDQTNLSGNNLATLGNNPIPLVDDFSSQEENGTSRQALDPNNNESSKTEEQGEGQHNISNPPEQDPNLRNNQPLEDEVRDITVTGTYSEADPGMDNTNNDPSNPPSQPKEDQNNNLENRPLLTENEEEFNPPGHPIDKVNTEISELQNSLSEAILQQDWSGLPEPVADYYSKLLKDFYTRFNVVEVESSSGELQEDGSTATLPVEVNISYRQKGREDIKVLKLPAAHWVWIKREQGFELSFVQRP